MTATLRREILAAFEHLKAPPPAGLIGPSRGDPPGEERIRAELAGKTWMSLEPEFMAQRWAAFIYLSSEGYRYYLPALLTRCLDYLNESNALIHSTIYLLTPSFWSLYYEGGDNVFAYQTAQFDERQSSAVCSFLGLAFDRLPVYQYASAKALKWGWNIPGHPAQLKCREYYYQLTHYDYPPFAGAERQKLVEEITAAFANTPYPGDAQLCGSRQGDEPAGYALEFRGLDWRTIHPDFLGLNYPALSFFTPEAFRYYLPAYLIGSLLQPGFNGDPDFHLAHGLVEENDTHMIDRLIQSGELSEEVSGLLCQQKARADKIDWRQAAIEKFSLFSLAEKRAIVSYLKHAAEKDPSQRIRQALDNYWLGAIKGE